MRKIIQFLYDYRSTKPNQRLMFLALCDDGTVWRQIEVPDEVTRPVNGILMIVDPAYHTEWERATEFDKVPTLPNRTQELPAE